MKCVRHVARMEETGIYISFEVFKAVIFQINVTSVALCGGILTCQRSRVRMEVAWTSKTLLPY